MRPSVHHYILPLAFLALHGILILPALLAGPHTTALSTPPRIARLHPQYSIPFGLLGFSIIYTIRWLVGGFPLPRDRRRRALASRIEWGLLFLIGVLEELWRWGLVRVLVELEGGKGGYGGTAAGLSRPSGGAMASTTVAQARKPGIWEGVYLMCWTWSVVESAGAWISLWPPSSSSDQSPRTPFSARLSSPTDRRHRYLGYGSFRIPTLHMPKSIAGDGGSNSSRTLHRPSDSSKSSVGKPQSFFTDLFIRKRAPGSIRSTSSSSESDGAESEREEGRVVSDPSSDGDDEDSSGTASNASLSRRASGHSTRTHSPTRPLLSSAPPSAPHTPQRTLSTPSLQILTSQLNDSAGALSSSPGYAARRSSLLRLSPRRGSSAHNASPSIYTIPLRTLPAVYPVLWRLTSLLTHLACGLLYAWFPSLILSLPSHFHDNSPGVSNSSPHRPYLEWWTLVVLLCASLCKGYSTVFWFRGSAAHFGVAWATGASLITAAMVFLVGLALWGIVDQPWD